MVGRLENMDRVGIWVGILVGSIVGRGAGRRSVGLAVNM
jgi:hypothetical protein